MKWVNYGTKKQRQLVQAYADSDCSELSQCYKTWSKDKADAYWRCRRICASYHGHGFAIVSSNGWAFSAAFLFDGKYPGTYFLCTITKDNIYFCDYA